MPPPTSLEEATFYPAESGAAHRTAPHRTAGVGAEAERLTESLAAALTKPLQVGRPTAARLAPGRRPLGYLSAGRRTWRGPGRGGGRGGTVAGRTLLPSFSSWLGLPGPQEPPH